MDSAKFEIRIHMRITHTPRYNVVCDRLEETCYTGSS